VAQDEPQVSVGSFLEQDILGKCATINEALEKWTKKGTHAGEQGKEV